MHVFRNILSSKNISSNKICQVYEKIDWNDETRKYIFFRNRHLLSLSEITH